MYLLKVRKYNGVNATLIEDEDEALRRMRLWVKHPECISAEVRRVQTIAVPYSELIAREVKR